VHFGLVFGAKLFELSHHEGYLEGVKLQFVDGTLWQIGSNFIVVTVSVARQDGKAVEVGKEFVYGRIVPEGILSDC
jgi:hypothetical protein